ncbi:hypothetical protein [uncultured Maricaulis sp.]|uniref:hypothetical protein n=1 Tax=uncultured Maricaulis sp. TaxID=174710 RepID=UPI0030DB5603|tara:strand:+ start:119948 stop:120685 length:738 start_codon:yes stop_codon:yes gene_type:complete
MKNSLFCAALMAGLIPAIAAAEPGVTNVVYGPSVEAGETEIELRYGRLNGGGADGRWATVGEYGHAVTDWWRPAALFEVSRDPGGEAELEAVAFENVFDFTATRNWPVHFGAYAEYEANLLHGADKVELKLLSELNSGPARLRVNLIGEREVGGGAGDEWEYGYAIQGLVRVGDELAVGLEAFGDAGTSDDFGSLNDRARYIGPFVEFEAFEIAGHDVEVQAGYLFANGDAAADGQARLKFELEF